MKILVINGDCILTNTSANLCHLAYIRGLVTAGHNVTLICAEPNGHKVDPSMVIPDGVKVITFECMTIYEKLALQKRSENIVQNKGIYRESTEQKTIKSELVNVAKKMVRFYLGPHSIYGKFAKVAQKYRSDETYDVTLSLATPASSHLLAYYLIRKKRIISKKWIQIWEDPWYLGIDVSGNKRVRKAEEKLLRVAEKVCYVSPITLLYQQREFNAYAFKMYWKPLPHYYQSGIATNIVNTKNVYGYFGEYSPNSRNLKPFYDAAIKEQIEVNICGNPYGLFNETDLIHIYPRLTLEKLKPIEDSANILIFLCNKKGGQIPGKIYQYSATYKTILFILDGINEEKRVIREYFEKYKRYVFCDNDVNSIRQAIRYIERNELIGITNHPVDAFRPERIIEEILAID